MTRNTFFDKFGRNDFEKLTKAKLKSKGAEYVYKYVFKDGESIFYSRGIPSFIIASLDEETDIFGEYISVPKVLILDTVFGTDDWLEDSDGFDDKDYHMLC